jgi:hypothetical protein
MADGIERFVFAPCANANHARCTKWDVGTIHGVLHLAGKQCSYPCHDKQKAGKRWPITGGGKILLPREEAPHGR